jgi:undecaprenyl-diphosphatase
MAFLDAVRHSDAWCNARVYRWRPPGWLRLATVGATRLGDGWLWAAIAAALLVGGTSFHRVLAAAAFAGLLATATFVCLKRRFRRPRPCDVSAHPVFRVRAPDRFSFPSGHTINAFAICAVLGAAAPSVLPALGVLAIGIAASRVLLGLHYVSDVVAGAVLGTLIGLATAIVFLR